MGGIVQTHPGGPGQGMPWLKVKVEQVLREEGFAVVRDEFGKTHTVPLHMRSKGSLPTEEEVWVISRDLGFWTFALCILPKPIEITGSTDGIPALASLLDWLDAQGFIINSTTDDRIRATHTHTHVAPDGGGTTTTDSL